MDTAGRRTGWWSRMFCLRSRSCRRVRRNVDLHLKPFEYSDSGIPHYWIVDLDPPAPSITVFHLGEPGDGYVESPATAGQLDTTVPFKIRIDIPALLARLVPRVAARPEEGKAGPSRHGGPNRSGGGDAAARHSGPRPPPARGIGSIGGGGHRGHRPLYRGITRPSLSSAPRCPQFTGELTCEIVGAPTHQYRQLWAQYGGGHPRLLVVGDTENLRGVKRRRDRGD